MTDREIGHDLGVNHNALRYATTTGRVQIRWEGARAPTIWTVPLPEISAADARLELARRYLHVFGPTTPGSFAQWAGIGPAQGRAAFEGLGDELIARRDTDRRGVAARQRRGLSSVAAVQAAGAGPPASQRRHLLPAPGQWTVSCSSLIRKELAKLWTSRVWPGALLVGTEIVGTWRRAGANVMVEPWRRLSSAEVSAVESEASALPLPGARRSNPGHGG